MNTRKLVKIMEHSRQSEGVTTALALKCMAFAQGRSLTSIGSTLHLSIVICIALLKVKTGVNPKASTRPTVGKQCVIAEVSSSEVTMETSQSI